MRKFLAIVGICVLASLALACTEEAGGKNRTEAVKQRNQVFDRAELAVPVPQTINFPVRRALAKFTERQDQLDHPWYVYILNELGTAVGYYVGQTYPVNACNFLSSTEDVRDDEQGNLVLTAPSLDGIFYGGAGASSGCDAWFFFDATTDAMIVIRGVNFFVADQPLRLEADPIIVASP